MMDLNRSLLTYICLWLCVVPFTTGFLQSNHVKCLISCPSTLEDSFLRCSTGHSSDLDLSLVCVNQQKTDEPVVDDDDTVNGVKSTGRRKSLKQLMGTLSLSSFLLIPIVGQSSASVAASTTTVEGSSNNKRSRTQGYPVQKTDDEWRDLLTTRQYQILRKGGTERQFSSVLEDEERDGTYVCAGCGTALFSSADKFHSGTGWPSFAASIENHVEIESLNFVQRRLSGAELRCRTCGGHLGDVFLDGWIFTGTRAAETGKRFCIDGSALLFKPSDGFSDIVVGDTTPPNWEHRLFL